MVAIDIKIRQIFESAQNGFQHHGKLVKNLKALQESSDYEVFKESIIQLLMYSLVISKRESAVERTLDFLVKFATTCTKAKDTGGKEVAVDEDDVEESMDPLLLDIFSYLLDHHGAKDRAVRFRVSQLVGKFLNAMGDEDTIDENLADRIFDCMMIRLKDKFPNVRAQAVIALSRLQDPIDAECPIIESFIHLMTNDSSPDVRRTCLCNISLTPVTLEALLERTKDIHDLVRRTAYQVLAEKVDIKALTIAQRLQILHDSLNDRSAGIRKVCTESLLKKWLASQENKVEKLLECLHVESSPDVGEQTLKELFKGGSHQDLLAHVTYLQSLSEPGLPYIKVSEEKLTSEVALYWRVLGQHLVSVGDTQSELQEMLIPEAVVFCDYILRFANSNAETSLTLTSTEEGIENKPEFILKQLLQLVEVLDDADEVGRRAIQNMVKKLLMAEKTPLSLISYLIKIYWQTAGNEDEMVQDLVINISDIKEPMIEAESLLSTEDRRSIEVKVGKVKVHLHEMMEALEQSLTNDKFQEAAEIKEKIKELEAEKMRLSSTLDQSLENQSIRVEKDDTATVLKCLTIAAEMLKHANKKKMTPTIKTLVQTLVWPSVQNEDPIVREVAVHCLGLCSLLDKDFATQHLVLFLQVSQIDHEMVQIMALKILFDLLLVYGLDAFTVDPKNNLVDSMDVEKTMVLISEKDADGDQEEAEATGKETLASQEATPNSDDESLNSARSVLSILTTFLDSESADLRTIVVEGMAKLLLAGRVQSAKLFSRMILLWYNPTASEDLQLRHCVGVFLPMFAFASRSNQEVIEESFLPIVETFINAPDTSPLSTVNLNNVVELLVHLTNSSFLQGENGEIKHKTILGSNVHDSLAERVANDILSDVSRPQTKTLCRVLTLLEITSTNIATVRSLQILCSRLKEEIKDAGSLKFVEKFDRTLNSILSKSKDGSEAPTNEGQVEAVISVAPREEENGASITDIGKQGEIPSADGVETANNDVSATAERLETLTLESREEPCTPAATVKVNQGKDTQKRTAKKKAASKSTVQKAKVEKSGVKTRSRKGSKKTKVVSSSDEDEEGSFQEDTAKSLSIIASVSKRESSRRNAKNSAMERTRVNLETMLDDSLSDELE